MHSWFTGSLRALSTGLFTFAALCLAAAIGYATWSIQQLTLESELLLEDGVYTTRLTDRLADQLTDLERTARQYAVVGSQDLETLFRERRARLNQTISDLEAFSWPPGPRSALADLRDTAAVVGALLSAPETPDASQFRTMRSLVSQIDAAADRKIDLGLTELRVDTARTYSALIAVAIIAILALALLGGAFRRLLAGPMRQIELSIQALGRADFTRTVPVEGPRDLAAIGTQLDWLRQRLAELEEQKSTFVRHVSHELKTPLANILQGAELLMEELGTDARHAELTEIVKDNSKRLHRLVENMLELAGWQDGQPALYPAPVALDRLIREVVQDHGLSLAARQIEVSLELTPVMLAGDEVRLRTLIDNLLGNALKYARSRVTVTLEVDASEVAVHVVDDGPGVPAQEREMVFEPFVRGHTRPQGTASGTGVGLALVKAYAEAHGGGVHITDEEGGAHFVARLART